MNDVTRIPSAIEQGEPHVAAQLFPMVYDELRKPAARKLAQEKHGLTLDATGMVHEAYLRLISDHPDKRWQRRRHLCAAAAEGMTQVRFLSEIIAFPFATVIMGPIGQPRPVHLVENCWSAARVISALLPWASPHAGYSRLRTLRPPWQW
jgi:hypothetical protein